MGGIQHEQGLFLSPQAVTDGIMPVQNRLQLYLSPSETVVQDVANLPTNLVVQSPTVQAEESKQTNLCGNSSYTSMRDLVPGQIRRNRDIWASPDVFSEDANHGKRCLM
jgi:hypothetical protein